MLIRLRHWREHRGYSVRELARRAGIGYVSVVRIENGHMSPTVEMLEKLAKELGMTVRDFLPIPKRPKPRRKGETNGASHGAHDREAHQASEAGSEGSRGLLA